MHLIQKESKEKRFEVYNPCISAYDLPTVIYPLYRTLQISQCSENGVFCREIPSSAWVGFCEGVMDGLSFM